MRLKINDSVFLSGRDGKPSQFQIWPKDFPQHYFDKMSINQIYVTKCEVENEGISIFAGEINAMRRQQTDSVDVLVLMLHDVDLGSLQLAGTIEFDVASLS
jgi:hypothetical protein